MNKDKIDMKRYCEHCEKLVNLTENGYCDNCGDDMLSNEEIIKQRDDAIRVIISNELIKKLRGEPNDIG